MLPARIERLSGEIFRIKIIICNKISGVRNKFGGMQVADSRGEDLEAELARVHAMLTLNSKVYKVFIYNCTFILTSLYYFCRFSTLVLGFWTRFVFLFAGFF